MRTFSFLLFLTLCFGLSAQSTLEYTFQELTIDDGLSHTDATCVEEDKNGFLWIGTYQGLDRFDGYEIKSFLNQDTSILSAYNNRIDDLTIDHRERVWLATQRGISCFSIANERYLKLEWPAGEQRRIEQLRIVHIAYVDSLDLLILGSDRGAEIFSVDAEGRLMYLPMQRNKATGPIYNFVVDRFHCLWILAGNGLYRQQLQRRALPELEHIELYDAENRKAATSSGLYLADDQLWIGNPKYLLRSDVSSVELGKLRVERFQKMLAAGQDHLEFSAVPELGTMHLVGGLDEEIWIGSPQGLFRAIPSAGKLEFEFVPLDDRYVTSGISSVPVGDLYRSRDGTLWIATYGGGVRYLNLNARPFYTIRHQLGVENTISGNYVRAILEDSRGNLWIGTRGSGLNRMDLATGRIEHVTAPVLKPTTSITNILEDHAGRIWVGTPTGLLVFHPDQNFWEKIRVGRGVPDAISHNSIFSLARDRNGQIWAGSWERGLNRIQYRGRGNYAVEQISTARKQHGLTSNKITYIYSDTLRNELLVATDNGINHLFLSEGGSITHTQYYRAGESGGQGLASNFVWPIQRTADGTIYAGTLGGGLNRIELSSGEDGSYRVTAFGAAEGNPSRDVETLLLDDSGRLWLGGNGLAVFDPRTETFQAFDRSDGLQSNSFKIGSAARGRHGRLYFGGINGLNYFQPDDVLIPSDAPHRLALSGLVVNQRTVAVGEPGERWQLLPRSINQVEKISLSHLENNFTLKFSSFNYRNPGKDRYRYRLLGYQDDWIQVPEGKREATFANLAYGDYLFQVEAAREDGAWHSERLEKQISIVAPWWLTAYAKVMYVLLFLAALAIAYYYLLRWDRLKKNLEFNRLEEQRMQEMHQMRLRFFTNISHEFRTPLTLIINPLREMLRNNVPARKQERYLRIMDRNAQRLLDLIIELMDFRKAETGAYRLRAERADLSGFAQGVFQHFQEHALINKVDYEFEAIGFTDNLWFDRKAMEKVIVNLLGNAFKYTPPLGQVKLSVLNELPPRASLPREHLAIGNGTSNESSDFVWLCVSDNGNGISAEDLPFVFARYYSNTSEQDKTVGSSGVGLALVRSIVQLHHGRIEVYSAPGEGTVFLIGLPTGRDHLTDAQLMDTNTLKTSTSPQHVENLPTAAKASQGLVTNTATAHRATIIFVEDNPELRLFVSEYFRDRYHVLLAENGAAAMEMVQEQIPNLIVSDIMMPLMDGVELCEAIRSEDKTRHIPVVLLTAKSSVESRLEGIGAGANYYLAKPFDIQELDLIVQNLLSHQELQQERFLADSFSKARDIAVREEDREFMDNIMKLINENLDKAEFNVDYLGRVAGLSRTKLYRRVKEATGKSVGVLIRKSRVQRAAELLASNNLTVVEVMYRVGIQSQSHFTKLFKKEFDKTPTEFVAGL